MKVSDLAANLKNPRTISDKKLAMLKKALEKFGDLSGIVFNRKSKQLVGGHQRRKLFGDKTPVTITKKYLKPTKTGTVAEGFVELNGERFSYREVSWDRPIELAANIAANNGAGEWDIPQLGEWLKELGHFDLNFDLDLTMFDDKERAAFLPETIEAVEGEDNVPATPKVPKARLGDLYELGEHRLLCGDSTKLEDVERLMGGEKAELCFTSPPYADQREYNGGKELSTEHLAKFISTAFGKVNYFAVNLGYSRKDGEVNSYWEDYIKEAKACGLKFISWNIWDKGQAGSIGNQSAMFAISHEWIFIFGANPKELNKTHENKWSGQVKDSSVRMASGEVKYRGKNIVASHSNMPTVFTHFPYKARNEDLGDHPAVFPVGFPEAYILAMTNARHGVYEPFGGSGTTLIACEKTKRRCFGMELDPGYCDVIVERWETFTGKKAKLMNSLKAPIRKPVKQGAKQVHGNA